MEKVIIDSYDAVYENLSDMISGDTRGVIELPVPVSDILDRCMVPSSWVALSGMSGEDVEKVIHYTAWAVTDPGDTPLGRGSVLTEEELAKAKEKYGENSFSAGTGAEAVNSLVMGTDFAKLLREAENTEKRCMARLEELYDSTDNEEDDLLVEPDPADACDEEPDPVQEEIKKTGKDLMNARETIDVVLCAHDHIEKGGFLITEIRMFPFELRPVLKEFSGCGTYAVYHDLAELYGNIADISGRIKRLTEIGAPDIILRSEKRKLQERVDALIANRLCGSPKTKENGTLFCSLMDVVMYGTRVI